MKEHSLTLNSQTVRAVVEHMNTDHADACLCIVRAFSEHVFANHAQLTDLDAQGLVFSVPVSSGSGEKKYQSVRINFGKPLRDSAQIRGALVALTRKARQKLVDPSS